MLERYAVKVARTVLRGGSGSNVTPLPDPIYCYANQKPPHRGGGFSIPFADFFENQSTSLWFTLDSQ
jgi:hypothetical protein